jgi:hypothetical protein
VQQARSAKKGRALLDADEMSIAKKARFARPISAKTSPTPASPIKSVRLVHCVATKRVCQAAKSTTIVHVVGSARTTNARRSSVLAMPIVERARSVKRARVWQVAVVMRIVEKALIASSSSAKSYLIAPQTPSAPLVRTVMQEAANPDVAVMPSVALASIVTTTSAKQAA